MILSLFAGLHILHSHTHILSHTEKCTFYSLPIALVQCISLWLSFLSFRDGAQKWISGFGAATPAHLLFKMVARPCILSFFFALLMFQFCCHGCCHRCLLFAFCSVFVLFCFQLACNEGWAKNAVVHRLVGWIEWGWCLVHLHLQLAVRILSRDIFLFFLGGGGCCSRESACNR